MAFNLGFGSNPTLGSSTVGFGQSATASQLQQLLQELQSQQQAGQQPTQLATMQQLTGAAPGSSPGGMAMGLPPNSAGAMQGGPSGMPGNPAGLSPGQMLQDPTQGMPTMGGASWPGMGNNPNPQSMSTSYPGSDGSTGMGQLSGTMNPQLVSTGLGLMAALAGNNAKNKQAQVPQAQSKILQTAQNGALARLLSGYGPSQMSGLMGAYGG